MALGTALATTGSLAAPPAANEGVGWLVASSDADVDQAFALAKHTGKPVFLYWGAVWCPPCNQVKATLFSRSDFAERSRAFVPVYVDGDKAGAQKVAHRFRVSGYPTMILFKPDGSEITRLPGEVDPERYLMALAAGLSADIPVKQLVQRAMARQALTEVQWKLLAFYSWDTDEQQVFKTSELADKLSRLSATVPADVPDVRDRLEFKAVATRARDEGVRAPAVLAKDRDFVERLLGNSDRSKLVGDLLVLYAEPVVKYLAPSAKDRAQLARAWDQAIERFAGSTSMSRGDQVDALDARVDLWKAIDQTDKLSVVRQQTVLKEVARIVAQTTDKYERQAVVPSAGHLLASAGLFDDSEALLKSELPRAVAPYYHMLGLASIAKRRGDAQAALAWYEQAWRKSEGPATRLQWGATYVREIIELTPSDSARVSDAAIAVITSLDAQTETFYGRNQRSLERMARALHRWETIGPAHKQVVSKVRTQLTETCSKLPANDPGRRHCDSVFGGTSGRVS